MIFIKVYDYSPHTYPKYTYPSVSSNMKKCSSFTCRSTSIPRSIYTCDEASGKKLITIKAIMGNHHNRSNHTQLPVIEAIIGNQKCCLPPCSLFTTVLVIVNVTRHSMALLYAQMRFETGISRSIEG